MLLGLTGVLIAGLAALGKAPTSALALDAAAVASALLSVLVVIPKLDRPNGFSCWARCTDPDALRETLADDVHPARLHALSVLCERRMGLLQRSARLALLAVLAVSAAALLSAA